MSELNTEQLNQLLKSMQSVPKKRISGFAKKLSYAIIIITFIIGVAGSFNVIPFNMEAFVSFIPMFASLFIPLILSIGINSALEKHEKAEVEKEAIRNKK
jgi:hypothetical protein